MTEERLQWDDRDQEFESEDPQEDSEDGAVNLAEFDNLILAPSDWTVGTIYEQIGKQIDLDPDFQRRNVWSPLAKSKFIESIFLGVPIPQILLTSKKGHRSSFLVLDGKQRLTTIREFLDGEFLSGRKFKLRRLQVLDELNNKGWSEISKDAEWRDRFLNATLRTAVLRGWDSEPVLYEIFHRLNSGSVRLSPMELRMSLHPGAFLKFIIQWTEKIGPLHHLLRKTVPDQRMNDVELAVRHLAFSDPNFEYRGNLKEFLDECAFTYNDLFDEDGFEKSVRTRLDRMNSAIQLGLDIFGDKKFCRKWLGDGYESRFNRALFDVLVGSLSVPKVAEWASEHGAEFEAAFKTLSESDSDFVRSIETTTKSSENTAKRFDAWYSKVEEISGVALRRPSIA
ncbi:DUF262 domain-containing protein [Sphingomicrobium aestuariivivum]|uniref:DUF262 domain-containing protein n=1 Tax=Sphingomicrobium aestuariivivum TaxID=1582356 RepID=UPI001FD65E59|nr:DUF262 domain-containing protein [Sphingomicrobium aestuariivivum]MCJ8191066.1 DUF262 domain-containing protein [Sphingomicrobium aestuariivivum]